MKILLSIKPKYAQAILNGTKTVEFRKTAIRQNPKKAEIYMSQTVKKIVGSADIISIKEDTPENLWETYHHIGGISKEEFFTYFSNKVKGYALLLDKVQIFPEDQQKKPKYVPQSFCYIK